MALQLPPETESRVREAADREGVTIEELLNRTFAPPARTPLPPVSFGANGAAPIAEATKETPEETRARVMGLLHKWQGETGMPTREHKSLAQLSAEWAAEDANMTDEEWEAERQFWEDFNRERDNRPLQI